MVRRSIHELLLRPVVVLFSPMCELSFLSAFPSGSVLSCLRPLQCRPPATATVLCGLASASSLSLPARKRHTSIATAAAPIAYTPRAVPHTCVCVTHTSDSDAAHSPLPFSSRDGPHRIVRGTVAAASIPPSTHRTTLHCTAHRTSIRLTRRYSPVRRASCGHCMDAGC